MTASVDSLMDLARPRADSLDREQVAAEVYAVLFGSGAPLVEIGRFVVESRLGSGGMGIVYCGYDPELDRRVAIKVLDLRRVSAEPALARARLQREARALAQLTHPNVVSVYDVGVLESKTAEARLYLVMEYVAGPTLRAWMRDNHELELRLAVLLGAGRGLAAAHAANLVHGDFKPDNILIGADGRPRVADFGLALPILEFDRREYATDEHENLGAGEQLSITISGVCGTPAYIAPEQCSGVRVDARADQFAFCVVACELLYGRRPFKGDCLESLNAAALVGDRVTLENRRVPRLARAALVRGLSADPRDRFPDMNALLAALEAGFARRKHRRRAIAATVVAGVLGLGAWMVAPPSAEPGRSCVAAETRLEPVWSRSIAAAIATRLHDPDGRGSASAQMLLARLDAHARRWGAAWTESCVVVADATTRERMQVCLDARMLEFAAVTKALADPQREFEAPLALLEELEPVATCLDALSLDAERPVPIEPERRRATEALRNDRLGSAKLASKFGRHDEALEISRQVADEAERLGYRPLEAEAELGWAQALQSAGRAEQAKAMAERAHLSAVASRHTRVLADAAILRVHLAYETANIAEARAWLAQASAANEAAGGNALSSVRLHGTACVLELYAGSYDAAVEQCEQAQELLDRGAQVGPQTSLDIGANFALAEYGAGLLDRADRRFATVGAAIEAQHGPLDPALIRVMLNWGHVAFDRGDLDAALIRYRRAQTLLAHSPDHADTVNSSIAISIADALRERGEFDEAATVYAEAQRSASKADDFWSLHAARAGLALVALDRGDARAALVAWSEQRADEREQLEPSHPWMLDLELNIGVARASLGEVDEGLAQIDAAIATLEREHGVEHVELIDSLAARGDVARKAKLWDRCIADLDRAHALEFTRSGPGSNSLASLEVLRADCRLSLGEDPIGMIDALEAAVEVLGDGPPRAAGALARVQLGRAYVLAERRDEGRAQLERAAEILKVEQGDHAAALATIAQLLD